MKHDAQRIRRAVVNEPLEEEIRKLRAQLIDLDRMLTPAGLARETDRINEFSNVEWSSSDIKRNLEAERASAHAALGDALINSAPDASDGESRLKDAMTSFREALKV